MLLAFDGHAVETAYDGHWAMNKRTIRWRRAAALISALLACMLAGCGKPSIEQQILGTWENAQLALTWQFDKEGKWSSRQVLPRLNHSTTGSWKLEGRTVVITTEASTLIFDGKPKTSPLVAPPERDEIVTLDGTALVFKRSNKDGRDELVSFHRVRRN
jgi:hypothetical protein